MYAPSSPEYGYPSEEFLNTKINKGFVEGKTLKYCVENNLLTQKNKNTILKSLAVEIDSLIKNGIVHGDLKPDNIIIKSNFNAEIIDFGSSKYARYQSAGNKPGSLLYKAPRFDSSEYDMKEDVYSLGMVIFFMESGRDPIEFDKTKKNGGDALWEYFGLVHSPQIRWVVGKLTALNTEDRLDPERMFFNNQFTDCDMMGVLCRLSIYDYDVDVLYSDYLNGCQYGNPLFIDGFFNVVAVDGNKELFTQRMKIELCLNGFSPFDMSLSQYYLELYSHQDILPLDFTNYFHQYIALDANDTLSRGLNISSTSYIQLIAGVQIWSGKYNRDSFLHASYLYTAQHLRCIYLQVHLSLMDNDENNNYLKIDPTVDPYYLGFGILFNNFTIYTTQRLLFKYHSQVGVIRAEDKAFLFADYFHTLNIDKDASQFLTLEADTLMYEAVDPHQVLQNIGEHTPSYLWDIADVCILVEIIYMSIFQDYHQLIITPKNNGSIGHEVYDHIQSAPSLFRELLKTNFPTKDLVTQSFATIHNISRNYRHLRLSWVKLLADRFQGLNFQERYRFFFENHKATTNKMLEKITPESAKVDLQVPKPLGSQTKYIGKM